MIKVNGKLKSIVEKQLQSLIDANKPVVLTANQRAVLQSYYCKWKRKIYTVKIAGNETELIAGIKVAYEQAFEYAKEHDLSIGECNIVYGGLNIVFYTNKTDDQLIAHYRRAYAMEVRRKTNAAKNKKSKLIKNRKAALEIIAKLKAEFNL